MSMVAGLEAKVRVTAVTRKQTTISERAACLCGGRSAQNETVAPKQERPFAVGAMVR